jgi:hypothetical protein
MNFILRKLIISFTALLLFTGEAVSAVYVYEVTTQSRRFQTASKLDPKAFLFYNGGTDIIKDLKVIQKYPKNEFNKALEDYHLGNTNYRQILYKTPPADSNYIRFIWWR